VNAGYTSTLSPTFLLDVRVSSAQFGEWRDPAQEFDPATLGFAARRCRRWATSSTCAHHLRQLQHHQQQLDDRLARRAAVRLGQRLQPPHHDLRRRAHADQDLGRPHHAAGYDLRYQQWKVVNDGYPGGRFQFNGAYTRANNSAP